MMTDTCNWLKDVRVHTAFAGPLAGRSYWSVGAPKRFRVHTGTCTYIVEGTCMVFAGHGPRPCDAVKRLTEMGESSTPRALRHLLTIREAP